MRLALPVLPSPPLGDAALALFRGLLAALLDALLEFRLLGLLLLGAERLVVARHQAAVGRALDVGHVVRPQDVPLEFVRPVVLALELPLEVRVVDPVLAILLLELDRPPHDLAGVLRREDRGREGEQAEDTHTYSTAGPGNAFQRAPVSLANFDLLRTMVWLRSGPVEMHPISTPIRLSRNAM